MKGEWTGKVGLKLREEIRTEFGEEYVVCVDHSYEGDHYVAVGKIPNTNPGKNDNPISISHLDIAVIRKSKKDKDGFSGKALVLCEIEEKCRGDVKLICGDILSMLAIDYIIIQSNSLDECKIRCENPSIVIAYPKEGCYRVDEDRCESLNDALNQKLSLLRRSIQIVRTPKKELKLEIINRVVEQIRNK